MKKLVGVYLFIFLILVVVFIYEYNKPQPVDWTPHLKANSKAPFGQKILINHLEDIFDTVEVSSTDFFRTAMRFEPGEPEVLPLEPTERTRHTRTGLRKNSAAVDSLISKSFHALRIDTTESAIIYEEETGEEENSEVEEQNQYEEQSSTTYENYEPERLAVNEKAKNSAYIISNAFFSVDETDFFSLFTYVAEGKTVFISTEKLSPELALIFQVQPETGTLPDTTMLTAAGLKNRTHELRVNRYYKDLFPKDKYYVSKVLTTSYFKLDLDCVADTVLVNQSGYPVMLAYACGKGKIYLSSMPLLFTNLEVLHGNRDLLTAMFNLVPRSKLYWDDYYKRHHKRFSHEYGEYQRGDGYVRRMGYSDESRTVESRENRGGESPAYQGERDRDYDPSEEDQEDKSILSFLMENDSLRWAWYTLMCTLALYMLSSARRRQKLIPLIHKLQNTTVEFVQMIARLYYLKKDHRDIALKKINYFQEYLRSRYYHKDLSVTESNIDSLARRSHKKPEQIKRLFELINEVQSSGSISAVKLHVLSQRINEFKSST